MPARSDLPSTLKRSPKKAQETCIKTHYNAVKKYGEGEHAHRVAFAALEHFSKIPATGGGPKGALARPIRVPAGAARRPSKATAKASAESITSATRKTI